MRLRFAHGHKAYLIDNNEGGAPQLCEPRLAGLGYLSGLEDAYQAF
jgi:hypothetical protein